MSYIANFGAIPRRDGEWRSTSITEHIAFVQTRNGRCDGVAFNFSALVLLFKWWRNHRLPADLGAKASSFFLGLVIGKAFDESSAHQSDGFADALHRLVKWLGRHRLRDAIEFPDPRLNNATGNHAGPVIVVDPMNPDNNIAHDWTVEDRERFMTEVDRFGDMLVEALDEDEAGYSNDAANILEHIFKDFRNWSTEQ